MSDLISGDELLRYVNERIDKIKEIRDSAKAHGEEDVFAHCNGEITEARGMKRYLNMFAPSVDAVPVTHARWERSQYDRTDRICSACHGIVCGWHEFADCTYEFCPWCGAKMDGGAEG